MSKSNPSSPTPYPYPILEYDSTREAFIEPGKVVRRREVAEACVLCFFQEVIDKVAAEYQARTVVENCWENGPHPIYEIEYLGQRLAFFHPGIGGPLVAALLEEAIGIGCRKFIVCGGCGALEKGLGVGQLVVVTAALRDEGTSYHYLPAGREVTAHPWGVAALEAALTRRGVPYRVGKTWTTDAPYRETRGKIARRLSEGCLAVEMEAASLMAVAEFRGVVLGQVVYGGDDLSGAEWDQRGWQSRQDVRENLFWLAAEACLALKSAPTPRQKLYHARLATARERLLMAIGGLDEQTLTAEPVVGDWTVKDMLGHIVSWDDEFRREIKEILAGKHPGHALVIRGDDDFAGWNQHWIDEKRDWTWEMILADVERDYQQAAQLIMGLTPEEYRQRGITPWKRSAQTRPALPAREDMDSVDTLVTFHWRHINQHVRMIERWKKNRSAR